MPGDTTVHSPECRQSSVWFTGFAPYVTLEGVGATTEQVVDVALIDGAADRSHPALAGHWSGGEDLVEGDGDPFLDPDVLASPELRREPGNAHATAIASILASAGPEVRIALYRALGEDCQGDPLMLAAAIELAADRGARIIVLPLGAQAGTQEVREAIRGAIERDVMVVAAAGNRSGPRLDFPARERDVLAVAALDAGDGVAPFASYGSAVALSDRGEDVAVAMPGGEQALAQGSSFAAARTAAAAAVVRAELPDASLGAVRLLLERTAAPVDEPRRSIAKRLGAGRTDAAAAMVEIVGGI
jgi:hypothetical protein